MRKCDIYGHISIGSLCQCKEAQFERQLRELAEQENLKCLHCDNKVWDFTVHICRTCDSSRLQSTIATLGRKLATAREALAKYGCHDKDCIHSHWEAGEPTEDGGYRSKFRGKWYMSKPIDETPKCECGFEEALNQIEDKP